jgi:hypothetical protein
VIRYLVLVEVSLPAELACKWNLVNITLMLPPEKQATLEQCAAAYGTDVANFILAMVDDKLDERGVGDADLPYSQWREQFQAGIASRRSRNPQVDDSRESSYH